MQKKDETGWVGWAFSIGVTALIFGWCSFGGGDDGGELDRSDTWSGQYRCEQQVKARMHDPRSARFDRGSKRNVRQSDGSILFAGEFSGTNAFGGTVRNGYFCRARYDAGSNRWTVLELTIQ